MHQIIAASALGLVLGCVPGAPAGDKRPAEKTAWPMFGGTPARNMVNLVDKNILTDWCVEEGKFKNIKWAVKLGNRAYAGPVIAGGRVYAGTNNWHPRDPKDKNKFKAVLMCFNEADGRFLWQNVHDIPDNERFSDVRSMGLVSTPVVDNRRVYYVTPSSEVICADAASGKILWRYDMMAKLDVKPSFPGCIHFLYSSCSPLAAGDKLFLVTGNGVHWDSAKVESPKAPSFVAFDKIKGTVAWHSNLPGNNIIEVQWSNPVYAVVYRQADLEMRRGSCAAQGQKRRETRHQRHRARCRRRGK